MTRDRGNLFDGVPAELPAELVERIAGSGNIRIERIVSRGHTSPDGFWYDQDEDEWVVLLAGRAALRFEHENPVTLKPGDYVHIPAHARHRVEWTSTDEDAVWLAVFYR